MIVSTALAACMSLPAWSEPVLPASGIPIPQDRPTLSAGIDNATTTASVAVRPDPLPERGFERGGDITRLKQGLDALSSGRIDQARAVRDALPDRALDHHILAWAIAMDGSDGVTSGEIAAAATTLPGWPGMAALRRNSERAMYREEPQPRAVVQAFAGSTPQTAQGAILLARSHVRLGQTEAARKALSPFWRTTKLDAKDEVAMIREFGKLIPAADHRYRMERMLYEDRVRSAERVAGLGGGEALAKAWAAVTRNQSNAGKLLEAVPRSQRTAGYVFAKARYLRRSERFTQAAEVMLSAPRDASALIDPDAWWVERRVLSRELLDIGKPDLAYKIAAAHSAESAAYAADAEFHAGWYALRALNDPKTASRHFAKVADLTSGPVSQARAYYWLGRVAEAGGPGNARDYYRRAAANDFAFYGQLAAARLGRSTIAATYPEPSEADRRNFASREAVAAIHRLEEAGYAGRADILYRALAEQLPTSGELALLAVMAERRGNHFLALRIGKAAALRGMDIGALAHPVGAIPGAAGISASGKALAYAVARQESEFNVGAVSPAGALGLLQLMPGTAKSMAGKAGLAFSKARLTTDAAYNATLGATYLGQQIERFDGSYILTFIGYNAGPRRAEEWVERYGDPRGKSVEAVVDWIERIPYTETRNYVQRVMENYQVYKMRLTGRMDIENDLVKGRR
nr:lytic transglycosylase domain-containing protein [Mesorhizobium xinjiangense]